MKIKLPDYNAANPNYKERILKILDDQHFMKHIAFQLEKIEAGSVEGTLLVESFHKQQNGFVHGGLTATLADIVTGFAAYTLIPENCHVVTAELKISYLNPGTGNKLAAKGWVLKQGEKLNFCEAEIWSVDDAEKIMIAKATATMANIFGT